MLKTLATAMRARMAAKQYRKTRTVNDTARASRWTAARLVVPSDSTPGRPVATSVIPLSAWEASAPSARRA